MKVSCDEESPGHHDCVDDVPLEILEDDGAFVQCARWGVCVQFESGNETFGRDVEELFGFLVRIYFVYAIVSVAMGERERVSSTILLRGGLQDESVRVNVYDIEDSTYLVRNAQVLERNPYPLDKGTETATEKGDIRIPRMCIDSVEGFTSTLDMIFFSRIHGKRHDRDGERSIWEKWNARATAATYFDYNIVVYDGIISKGDAHLYIMISS